MAHKKTTKREKIPKVVELVSVLASFLDSGTDAGAEYGMTRLSKEIEVKKGNPHVNTVRQKLTEGFLFKRVLENWEATYRKDGMVDRIRKVNKGEVSMTKLSDMILQLQRDMIDLKQELNSLREQQRSK